MRASFLTIATAELDTLSEESYKDSTLIMQLLRDNLVRALCIWGLCMMHVLTFACRPSGLRPRPSPLPLRPTPTLPLLRSRSRRRLRRSPRPSKRRPVPGLLIVITPGLLGKSLGGNGVFGARTGDPTYLCMFTADTPDLVGDVSRMLGARVQRFGGVLFLSQTTCFRLLTGEDRLHKK